MSDNTVLADLRASLHTSVSQVKSFTTCPMKHHLQYVRGVEPAFRPSPLVFGVTVHAALAIFYTVMQASGDKPPAELLTDSFSDRWHKEQDVSVPIDFDDGDEDGKLLDAGVALVQAFHENATVEQVQDVEAPFAIDLIDPATGEVLDVRVVGAVDLVTVTDGHVVIWDHKSVARRFTNSQLSYDIQPSVYCNAWRDDDGSLPAFQFQCLIKTKKPGWQINRVVREEKDVTEAMETIVSVQRAIEQGVCYRVRSWACETCPYRYACDGV